MTVSSQTRKAGPYSGTGSTGPFTFSFKVFQASDMLVVKADSSGTETTLVLTTDYTVSLNADQNANPGGTITLISALASGYKLIISSQVPYLQETDLTNQGGFYPEVITDALDKLTIEVQQIKLDTDRAAKVPLTSTISTDDLTADLIRLADSADNIDTVANNIGDVNTVAVNISDVNTVADNIADITNFANRYQGAQATDPSTRINGDPLQNGDLYFNTTYNEMRVFSDAAWRSTINYAATVERFNGTGSETVFDLSAAPLGENNTQIYISGVYQQKNTYSVTGTTIRFDTAPPSGTGNIEVVIFQSLIASTETDSSLVQYVPQGTGGVTRTVQARLRDRVSYNDYSSLRAALETGKRVLIPSSVTSISISTTDSPYILPYLDRIDAEAGLTLNLASGTHTTSTGSIANIGQNNNITLTGANVVSTTLSSIASVSGSAGNWTVKINVADTTGIAVGDVIQINDVAPGKILFSSASLTRRPYSNEMAIGIYSMGEISTTTGGTTATTTASACGSFLQSGDLVTIRGETKVVDTVGTNSFTVTTPFEYGITGFQWWYYHKANTGTIAASASSTITGTGTAFTTEANVGDLLVVDGRAYKITAIASDTSLTVTHAATIASSSPYTIMAAGILHEGSFLVTGISENEITYTSKARHVSKLPVNGIVYGTVKAIKTVLKQSGTGDGLRYQRGATLGSVSKVALVGNNSSTTSSGVRTNYDPTGNSGTYNVGASVANLDGNVAAINWGSGATLSSGCTLHAMYAHFCNNLSRGVSSEDGGQAYLRDTVVSHNNGIGILGGGGYVRISSATICANSLQGMRINVGQGVYGDSWNVWGNGSHGAMAEGGCGMHFVDSISCCNGGSGVNFQNGPSGRVSRTMFAGNANYGISSYSANMEAGQIWATGTGTTGYGGVVASRGSIDLNYSAQTGNAGAGIYSTGGNRCYAEYTVQRGNNSYGIRAEDFNSSVLAYNSKQSGNAAENLSSDGGMISDPLTQYGVHRQTTRYSGRVTIANDAVTTVDFGSAPRILKVAFHCDQSATLQGAIRIRTLNSLGCASIYGTGFSTTTGVLTGTTGAPGAVTFSPAADGKLYIENRSGGSRTITYDTMGYIY